MKISPVKIFSRDNLPRLNFKGVSALCDYPLAFSYDVFEKSKEQIIPDIDIENPSLLNNGLDISYERITPEKFLSVRDESKEAIYRAMPPEIRSLAAGNAGLGVVFKDVLDKKYGKDGYKFVSIGTSPASVAKALELMGEDVVYLPMSFSKTVTAKPWLDNSPYIDFYKKYMADHGLSNETLQKEGKKAVVCDYTITGRSLELAEYMLKGSLGLDASKVDTITMNEIVSSAPMPANLKAAYLNDLLKNEKIGDFCDVPHFSFLDKSYINRGAITCYSDFKDFFDTYKGLHSNSYNFCLMKCLYDSGLLKKTNA